MSNILHRLSLEAILLLSMAFTLLIPPIISSIIVWTDIPSALWVRAFIWLLGISILPGLNIIRLSGLTKRLTRIGSVAVAVNLSLLLIGLITLILYTLQISVTFTPWVVLLVSTTLFCLSIIKERGELLDEKFKITKWQSLLTLEVVTIVIIALLVQLNQRYLIPGDNWVSLQPSVEVLFQRDVYRLFATTEYPLMFGFILGGMSACSGLPITNTYVVLFPLIALNVLTFYALVTTAFGRSEKLGAISSIIYGLGGGLGFLMQLVIFQGTRDFWTLSFLSQDMYFFTFFWNSIEFSYKLLAVTLLYTALILFASTIGFEGRRQKIFAIALSSIAVVFAFFIHMLDAMILAPMIIASASIYFKGRNRLVYAVSFLSITFIAAYLVDFATSGYYFSLTIQKMEMFASSVNITGLLIAGILVATIPVLIITRRFLMRKELKTPNTQKMRILQILKVLVVFCIALVYVGGLFFWAPPTSLAVSSTFSWFHFATRYGFIGGLAIVGLIIIRWREDWFLLASFWSIFAVIFGSLWWGERTNAYLFPMLAIFAAVTIEWVWQIGKSTNWHFPLKGNASNANAFRGKKLAAATLILIILLLSFTSMLYGANYYSFTASSTTDDDARMFAWITQNTPQNITIIVPNDYIISKGVSTIGDRQIYQEERFFTSVNATSFINLTESLSAHNIRYAIGVDGDSQSTDIMKSLLSLSTLIFRSGKIELFKLPQLKPPAPQGSVKVIDRAVMGIRTETGTYGWFDDEFTNGWTYKNLNTTSDGETVTMNWSFRTGNLSEPSMTETIPSLLTNDYPYFIIRYRNTAETSTSAENNVGQIVTLLNASGYPSGFIKNIYLPISEDSEFTVLNDRLPANQSVSTVGLWLRNYQNLNGTIGLQIDYLGFASDNTLIKPEAQMRFLSMALPSLWPTDYSVSNNFNQSENPAVTILTYDKSAPSYINNSKAQTVVLLNDTADFPNWGTQWTSVNPEIVSGYFAKKQVIIVGIAALQGGISQIAEVTYETIVVN